MPRREAASRHSRSCAASCAGWRRRSRRSTGAAHVPRAAARCSPSGSSPSSRPPSRCPCPMRAAPASTCRRRGAFSPVRSSRPTPAWLDSLGREEPGAIGPRDARGARHPSVQRMGEAADARARALRRAPATPRSSSARASAGSPSAIDVEADDRTTRDLPGFPLSTVESHAGRLLCGTLGRQDRDRDAGTLPPLRGLLAAAGHLPGARAARARRGDAGGVATRAAGCIRCGRRAT